MNASMMMSGPQNDDENGCATSAPTIRATVVMAETAMLAAHHGFRRITRANWRPFTSLMIVPVSFRRGSISIARIRQILPTHQLLTVQVAAVTVGCPLRHASGTRNFRVGSCR